MSKPDHERFMRIALQQAALALPDKLLPVGAVAVLDGEIIAKSRKQDGDYQLDHAEQLLIRGVPGDLRREITIYTTLEPCIMCLGTILHCGVKHIVFALEDPYGGATNTDPEFFPMRHRARFPEIVGGILREPARELFRQFCQKTDSSFWKNPENPFVKMCLS
jgi:tRNA(adenine34) deaminase